MIIKHIHRLKRHKYKNGEAIYFCVKDDCSFKVNIALALGKTAECWRCDSPFSMTLHTSRMDKPHCVECTKKKESVVDKLNLSVDSTITNSIKNSLRNKLDKSISRIINEPINDDTDML